MSDTGSRAAATALKAQLKSFATLFSKRSDQLAIGFEIQAPVIGQVLPVDGMCFDLVKTAA